MNETKETKETKMKTTSSSGARLSTVIQFPLNDNSMSDDANSSSSSSSATSQHHSKTQRQEAIMINNAHKTYLLGVEGVAALRGVSLSVGKGEFVMLLGKSGSGKTSLLNLIGTIDRQTRGDLRVCGTWLRPSTSDAELARLRLTNLGFVFQTFNLIPSMNALDNVALPMLLSGGLSRPQAYSRAKQLLEDVGMGPRISHVPSQLSGGEQQRVTIARALSNKPALLLLDEPTGDLDSVNTDNVMSILTKLSVETGVTMIMVTHDPHLRSYAHRAIHMLDGKIVRKERISDGARAQLLTSKGLGHLVGRGYGTGDTEGSTQTSVDLEAAVVADEDKQTKVIRPMMLAECTMTEVRAPMHYANVLGGANKTPALMAKAMQMKHQERRHPTVSE
jgi:putative ABC transport system ATP-binding protein